MQVDSAWLPSEYKLAEIDVDRQPHWISLSTQQPSTGYPSHLLWISVLYPFAEELLNMVYHISFICAS